MENVQGGFVEANTKILNEAKDTLSATQQTQSKAQANEELSKAWATSTESPDNEEDTQSSTGKTQSSRSWALYSEGKAQEAATSEAHAKTSETNAKASETKARLSEQNAKVSETNAKSSETNAKTSEQKAKTSETNAKSSETKSKESENAARVSEQNAAESARIATEYGGDFNMLKRNKVYSVGDIAYSPNLPSWAYLECITVGTTGDTEPDFNTGVAEIQDGSATFKVRNITELVKNLEDLQIKNTQLADKLAEVTTIQKVDVSFDSTYVNDVVVYKSGHIVNGFFTCIKSISAKDFPIITNLPRAISQWGDVIVPFRAVSNNGDFLRIQMEANTTVINLHYSSNWVSTSGNEAECRFTYITDD